MAHGAPDWWNRSYVDIMSQTLAEIINRPKYGGGIRGLYHDNVSANTTTTLVEVTGKGMIYGGRLRAAGSASQRLDEITLKVDGQTLESLTWDLLYVRGYIMPGGMVFYLTVYDEVDYIYSLGIGYGFTFENSVKLQYTEKHGNTPHVSACLLYALV